MASSPLEQIAASGIAARSPEQARELIEELKAIGGQTADPRYGALAIAVEQVETWRAEHEAAGGVPSDVLEEIDTAVRAAASAVIEGVTAAELGESLERTRLLLTGPDEWVTRGRASRKGSE